MNMGFKINLGGLNRDQPQPASSSSPSHITESSSSSTIPNISVPPLGPGRRTAGAGTSQSNNSNSPSNPHHLLGGNNNNNSYQVQQSSDRGSIHPISSDDRHGQGQQQSQQQQPQVTYSSSTHHVPHAPLSARGPAAGASSQHQQYSSGQQSGRNSANYDAQAIYGHGQTNSLGMDATELLGINPQDVNDIDVLRNKLEIAQRLFVTLEKRYEFALREKDKHFSMLLDELKQISNPNESAHGSDGYRSTTSSNPRTGDVLSVGSQTLLSGPVVPAIGHTKLNSDNPPLTSYVNTPNSYTIHSQQQQRFLNTSAVPSSIRGTATTSTIAPATSTSARTTIRPSSGIAGTRTTTSATTTGSYTIGTRGSSSNPTAHHPHRFSGNTTTAASARNPVTSGTGAAPAYQQQNHGPPSSRGSRPTGDAIYSTTTNSATTSVAPARSPRGNSGSRVDQFRPFRAVNP
jgi:hypothetical protein